MAYTTEDLDFIKTMLADRKERFTLADIAEALDWRLSNGRPNHVRAFRAIQRIKRDAAGGKPAKSISPRDIMTVGEAIKSMREILDAIPRRLHFEPLNAEKDV